MCQQQTPPLHTLPISSFFYLLAGPVKDHAKYQRRKFLQQQKKVNQDLFYPLALSISKFDLFEKTYSLLKSQKTHAT